MNLTPEISPDFGELIALARMDGQIADAVLELLQGGLPFAVANVDNLTTSPTGDRVFIYELPKELKVFVAAARTRQLNAEIVPIGNDHDPTSPGIRKCQ
jgi:hypothetical protein